MKRGRHASLLLVMLSALGSILMLISMISCKDAITTNDPRQEIIDTKVAVVVTIPPIAATNLVLGDTSLVTVTVHDTNQYSGVTILSASVAGVNAKDFLIIDSVKFPLVINAKDSASFRVRFTPSAGNIIASLNLEADSGNVNVSVPLNYYGNVPKVVFMVTFSLPSPTPVVGNPS